MHRFSPYTFFQSVYSATGTPYFLTQARNTPAAAQVVSSLPMRARVSPLASSTIFIKQPRGPRSSPTFQAWKLPSICTNSPTCSFRSRRLRCMRRFPRPTPQPFGQHPPRAASAHSLPHHRRSPNARPPASAQTALSFPSPEYFLPTNRNTRSRNFFGFLRFDSAPRSHATASHFRSPSLDSAWPCACSGDLQLNPHHHRGVHQFQFAAFHSCRNTPARRISLLLIAVPSQSTGLPVTETSPD